MGLGWRVSSELLSATWQNQLLLVRNKSRNTRLSALSVALQVDTVSTLLKIQQRCWIMLFEALRRYNISSVSRSKCCLWTCPLCVRQSVGFLLRALIPLPKRGLNK